MRLDILNFQNSYNELIQSFAKKYYWKDAYVENELERDDIWLHPINISDDYWRIDDIYLAMQVEAPKERVLWWQEFDMEQCEKWWDGINFYNYLKIWTKK